MEKIAVSSSRAKQVIDITEQVEQCLTHAGTAQGLCNIFVRHTTAALTTGEAIEGTDLDLSDTLTHMIPRLAFRHAHDPSHTPDHMASSVVGGSLTIPFRSGKLLLGTWQRVLLVERNGPRERELLVTVIPA